MHRSPLADANSESNMTPEMRARYIAAGLPTPVYIVKSETDPGVMRAPRDTVERLSYDGKVGSIVHAVLAQVADPARSASLARRTALVADAIEPLVTGRRDLGRGDKTTTRVTGLVAHYLGTFLPPAEAEFLGAEVSVAGGRVDLAWRLPGYGVWFDELKTWRGGQPDLTSDVLDQVFRYLDAGIADFGAEFCGVRLVTLGNAHAARFITSTGDVQPLTGSGFGLVDQKEKTA